jgi:hypothetical protein
MEDSMNCQTAALIRSAVIISFKFLWNIRPFF